jgi:hypothetical protein
MKTLFLSMMIYSALSAPAEAFNPVKFVKATTKLVIRTPGSLIKGTADGLYYGLGTFLTSYSARLAGARDGQG